MAERKTKKKTSKKIEIQSTQDFIDGVNDSMPEIDAVPDVNEEVSTPISKEEKVVKPITKEKVSKFRFISTISHLNISNILFDNINIIVYECEATDMASAIAEFTDKIYKRFNGSQEDYIKFINGVFGSRNNVILEQINVNNITQEIITL